MKRDIRTLFNEEEDLQQQLPENHRNEFIEKLKANQTKKHSNFIWLKVAATVILALSISYAVVQTQFQSSKPGPIVSQIEVIESEYLKDIETEWQNFLTLADDEVLVERFRRKLNDLDSDYKSISADFKNDTNNIQVIEDLVENLQTRLSLLKDIQKHINILNQKNEQNETSI